MKFKSVAEAAGNLAEDPKVQKAVVCEIRRNSLVSALIEMRVSRGLTQEEVARAIGCDASKVSRLESGNDRQLRLTDIIGYAKALDVNISMMFEDPSLPAAERIKLCVFRIDQDLENLAKLAKEVGGDDDITKEINRFYRQVLFNFLVRFKKNAETLTNVIQLTPAKAAPTGPELKALGQTEKRKQSASGFQTSAR